MNSVRTSLATIRNLLALLGLVEILDRLIFPDEERHSGECYRADHRSLDRTVEAILGKARERMGEASPVAKPRRVMHVDSTRNHDEGQPCAICETADALSQTPTQF